ncbi:T9SS type A sorting domain-containing protein [Phaeodactylibacter sp.]|uniref:T9SS type A sorting domain-containing protein n=1 Tax=Phaeodactylibacter sp. TaxID=1940289 RepID=UPI0025D935AC|nr:T9SS type A sorting domain-containing protein [Phaeodactylibacter sp.]MCI4650138.1 T9SS type A sorting domain-containing protein [Phaeodactylibacter sp.]MCI5090850.1 T9SS type A sorting domain-containing protein [Phaeodactylibacter sp.]
MYLPTDFPSSIFVSVKKKQHPVKFPKAHIRTVIGALLCLFLGISSPLTGQQVWPGDVSGNGIVDHQDVLFWAYARNRTGAMRPNASTEFVGQEIPADSLFSWSGTFPNTDRSLAFADCDGNGIVNDLDLLTIDQNYFLAVSGETTSDQFTLGDNPIGSQLVLGDDATIDITAGQPTSIPLNLATQSTQPIELSYLGFQLNYGTELIAETPEGNLLLTMSFDIDGNEWLTETGENVKVFVHHHEDLGFSDIALYMDSPNDFVTGTGAMAEFTIVVEEVVFGLQDINITNPLILNSKFKLPGYVGSQGITINLVGKPVSTDEQMLPSGAVMVFPNPVNTGVLHAQLRSDQPGMIKQMELFDQTGRLVSSCAPNARNGQLNANVLPAGLYLLKVKTDKGVQVMKIQATR